MAQWFRLYESVLDDPKVQRLKPDVFRAWINMLALASRHDGNLPDVADIAFALRVPEEKAAGWANALYEAGLLDRVEDGTEHSDPRYSPHNWASRQFKSDVSNERVKRYRERHSNAPCNVTVTPSESEQIQNRTEQRERATRSGSRLPDDWVPSDEDRAFARQVGIVDIGETASVFCDYWHALAGAKGRKVDWAGTWRNWCRREVASIKQRAIGKFKPAEPQPTQIDGNLEWRARLRGYTPGGLWMPNWGPRPEDGGRDVPAHLITEWARNVGLGEAA